MLLEKMNDHFHLSLQLTEKTIILNMYLFDFWKNGGLYLYNNYFIGAAMTDLSKEY